MNGQKPREIAAQILHRWDRPGSAYAEILLEQELEQHPMSTLDRALCQELVYGIIRWRAALDWLVAARTRGRKQPQGLQDILRLGLYQAFWLDRIPEHATVNETVELARRRGFGPQAGFVNAVLRGYLRESDATRQRLADLKSNQPAIGYSQPDWLVERWQRRWGRERTAQLLDWNNTPPKTFARVNSLKTDAERLLPRWREEGVEYDFVRRDWFDENLVFELKRHPPIAGLPSFAAGAFYVQDPSTLFAVRELAPNAGEHILDLCAAPGGKATFIAQLMGNQGKIVCHDPSPDRLKLLAANVNRLGVTCVETTSSISRQPGGPMFDRVLIDAPCSNTGVMRRRVDLRWRIRPEEIERLRAGQLELLKLAASLLKPAGVLVYSTCSLEPEENRGVIDAFLASSPEFKFERERELLPFADNVDGAYAARLVRV